MLHLFDDLWLDEIIPKNNDRKESDIWNIYRLHRYFYEWNSKAKDVMVTTQN
jgi:hypothetical protein